VQNMALMLGIVQGGPAAAAAFETYAARAQRPRLPLPGMTAHEVLFATDTLAIADATVVIPLYNYADTVVEALESARLQTIERLDLVVVDDCSTDASLQVVLDWVAVHAGRFSRVVVARNAANQGLGATRNTGFSLADTPWVMALDADNRLRPGCVQACLETAERGGVAFAYPIIQHFGDDTDELNNLDWDPTRLITGNFVDAMALISRAAWIAAGGYDTVRTGWEDFDLWCCFAELGLRGERVPGAALAEYRVHGSSMIKEAMRSRDKVRWMMGHLTQRHRWLNLLSPTPKPIEVAAPAPLAAKDEITVAPVPTERLEAMLPLLRCPVTGGGVVRGPDGEMLVSTDGTQSWPIVAGRPVFFRSLGEPRLVAEDHLSNRLPDSAVALIEQTRGQVLHLSAGGSTKRYDHVIEAEAAIFRHTDIIADVHDLPFADETFEAVIALNAFEHYRDPKQAAREILRVLRPGGRVLIRTAFLQPQHEVPWHFYNCTRYGLEAWFEAFETQTLWVSENFNPGYSLSWLASECEAAVRKYKSAAAAELFMQAPMSRIVSFWRTSEETRGVGDSVWQNLATLPQEAQEGVAAGFEYVGRKPSLRPA
jgi:GT2 family glycosyltransferase/SAM-dependent methyltransferase